MSERTVEVLPRSYVEYVASIVGPLSAAAWALACADEGVHGASPVFFRPLGQRDSRYLCVTAASNLAGRAASTGDVDQ